VPSDAEPRWLDEQEQAAWRRTIAGTTRLLDDLDRDLRTAHDLTLADYEILVHLSEAPDQRLRMNELAEQALVSRPRLTHRVNRMEARNLVEREACPTDRRGTFAVLTAEGRAAIELAAPTHVASVRRLVVDVMTTRQLEQLGELMGRVADAAGPPTD
jgi:DNA-binding MarR family transcriptional regulator